MTVEAAIAVGSLVAVLMLCVAAVLATTAFVRCVDAAREAARLQARGDGVRVVSAVAAIAPHGAVSQVTRGGSAGDTVTARVSVGVPLLPGLVVSATAVAYAEPGSDDG